MSTIKSASLYNNIPPSDKEYHIQLVDVGNKYVVNAQWGPRGNANRQDTKTPSPVGLATAEDIYEKLIREKMRKGYQISGGVPKKAPSSVSGSMGYQGVQKQITLPQLLNTIDDASVVQQYINDDDYCGQEKMDGERRMTDSSDMKKIFGINKKGNRVDLLDDIKDSINISCVLDGEQMNDKLYAFDVIELNGKDLKQLSFSERTEVLNSLSFGDGIELVKVANTKKEKQELFDRIKRENGEGIVFKLKKSKYVSGRPNSGGTQLKYKLNKTATFRVSGLTPNKRSVELIVYGQNGPVEVGKVTIPPNKKVPEIGDFVEVRYLYAHKGGALTQPVYLDKRNDCDKSDAGIGQLVYKQGQ